MQQKESFMLTLRNTTGAVIPLALFNEATPANNIVNARTKYQWNITGENYQPTAFSIQAKRNASDPFVTYTGTATNPATLVIALNRLNIGTFWIEENTGNIYLTTYNDGILYGEIVIGTPTVTGKDWTLRTSPAFGAYNSLIYASGLFVAGTGASGTSGGYGFITSPNGVNWTARPSPLNAWTGLAYGLGLFVAVGNSGTVNDRLVTSPDAITWTLRTIPEANAWNDVAFGNGRFVAVASSGTNRIMYSLDGITWTAVAAPQANTWLGITYGNGLFVACSGSGTNRIMTSPDGITWTLQTPPTSSVWVRPIYANGQWVVTGTNVVMTSPDTITWTVRAAITGAWRSIAFGKGLYVAVSGSGGVNSVMTSPDAITWTVAQAAVSTSFWEDIVFYNGMFVAVASGVGAQNPALTVMTSGILA